MKRTHRKREGLADARPFFDGLEGGVGMSGIEHGRCGDRAASGTAVTNSDVRCVLTWGHGGWHRGDDGSEWTRGDAGPRGGTDLISIVTAAINAGVTEFTVTDSAGRSYDIRLGEIGGSGDE